MSRVVITRVGKPRPRLVLDQIGDDSLSGGHGGWETTDRPGRTAMTSWVGTPAQTWTLPLSLDGMKNRGIDETVERDLEVLESWARPGDDDEPPRLTVTAQVGRGRATARWVIQSIELGEQVRDADDQRVRQDLTLNLLEYVPGQILKGPGAKSRAKGKNKGKGKGKDGNKGKGK